jgi:hypothetical protein
MAYLNKVKSDPATIVDQAIGLKDINIGVNTNRTYGGSPYTGWYNTLDISTKNPNSIVMYKANPPVEGAIKALGIWQHDFSGDLIPLVLDGSWTMECWVLFPVGPFGCSIVSFGTLGSSVSFEIDSAGKTRFLYNGSTIIVSTSAIPTNTWTHIAVTRQGGSRTVNLYINGTNVGSANFEPGLLVPSGVVQFFKGSSEGSFYFTNLRVVTQTAIYPTESLVATYPQYPLNRSYDDTAVLILGKKGSNFEKDYSLNGVKFDYPEDNPIYEFEISTPLKKIIDATKVSVSPWNITNISIGLLELINGHPSRFEQPYFSNVDDAVEWAFEISTDPLMFSNMCYEETDGGIPYLRKCKMFLDSGNISSYPIVKKNHYNLREYNAYGNIDTEIAEYSEQYGGRLWSNKATPPNSALTYDPSTLYNASSFIYYGVIGFAETFIGKHDIVGFYGGNHSWRVERTSATQAILYVTNGSSVEVSLGPFNITGTEFPTPYFGLQVHYDNSTGEYKVFVNGLGVLSGTNPLSRPSGAGGSKFVFGYQSDTQMYHYTSAVWTEGTEHLVLVGAMAPALSVRYPGII